SDFWVQIQEATEVRALGAASDSPSILQQPLQAYVLTISDDRPELRGVTVPLFFEVAAKEADSRRKSYSELLLAAYKSGFPLTIEAQTGLVVDEAQSNSAEWDLLRLPVTAQAQTSTKIRTGQKMLFSLRSTQPKVKEVLPRTSLEKGEDVDQK